METNFQIGKIDLRQTLASIICLAVIAFGIWEALLGWGQLLGYTPSRHSLYPATGTFFNPGPFCGFLAMIMPLAVGCVLRDGNRIMYWAGWLFILPALGIMPSLMGRTGWIAAAVGCLAVGFGSGRIRRPDMLLSMIIVMGAVVVGLFVVWLKPASAFGRLLIWRDGLSAAMISPLTGVGWHGVGGALGAAQEAYFAANPSSALAAVAGTPEYAFNEFLQIAIAFGIPAALVFIALLVTSCVSAFRSYHFSAGGSLLAFSIVCFSSYPLQFPEFLVCAALLVISVILCDRRLFPAVSVFVGGAVAVTAFLAVRALHVDSEKAQEWSRIRYAYQHSLSRRDIAVLDSLSDIHGHSSRFLFDYGKALRENGLYEKSDSVLRRGLSVSSDPMFLNLLGRNSHDCHRYAEAEEMYRRSITRLPGRMYPYYLLARLHADSLCFDRYKFMMAYEAAMDMDPKVMSPAIRQMRTDLRHMHDSITALTPHHIDDFLIDDYFMPVRPFRDRR